MSEFAARLSLYGLTTERLNRAVRLAPRLAAVVRQAVDAYIDAAGRMPNVGTIIQYHGSEIRLRLRAHFNVLVSGRIDASYAAHASDLARWETELGLDARARATAGNMLLCACLKALAQRSPLGSRAVAEQGALIAQLLAFDLASTITAHQEAVKADARGRYENLTRDLAEFTTGMDGVSTVVQETAEALTDFSISLRATAGAAEQATGTVVQALDSAAMIVGVAARAAKRISESNREVDTINGRNSAAVRRFSKSRWLAAQWTTCVRRCLKFPALVT